MNVVRRVVEMKKNLKNMKYCCCEMKGNLGEGNRMRLVRRRGILCVKQLEFWVVFSFGYVENFSRRL